MSFRSPESASAMNRSTEPSTAIMSKSSSFPLCRSDARSSESSDDSVSLSFNSPGSSIRTEGRRFTCLELLRMTNNFETILGEWSSGAVYHGRMDDIEVAVYLLYHPLAQDYNQFSAELEPVLRVNRRNFVRLVGYCYDGDSVALIYELMANGDLKEHLSGGLTSSMSMVFLDDLASRMTELPSKISQSTPAADIGTVSIGVKFDGTNYSLWTQVMEMYISRNDKLEFISRESPQLTSTDPSYWKWQIDDAIVKSWIINSMETSLIGNFIGFPTTKQVWNAVAMNFLDSSDRSRIYNLQCQVVRLKQNGGSLEKFYNELQGLWREIDFRRPNPMWCSQDIKSYNSVVQEDRVYIFLDGLDDRFNGIRQEILQMRPFPNVEQAYNHVRQQASCHRVVVNEGTEDITEAFLASSEPHAIYGVNGKPNSNTLVKNKGEQSQCSHCAHEQKFSLVPAKANNMRTREPISDGKGIHGESILTWETGIRVTVDEAQGLEYLHCGSNPPMFKFIFSPELAFPPNRSPEPSSASLSKCSSMSFPFPPHRSDTQSLASSIDSFHRLSIDRLFPGYASPCESVSLSFTNPLGNSSSTRALPSTDVEEEVNETLQIDGTGGTKAQLLRGPLTAMAQLLYHFTSRLTLNLGSIEIQIRPQRKDTLIVTKKRRFTYSKVRRMTHNFERVIGHGSFGTVYLGHLYDTDVAVKLYSSEATQGYQEFMARVELSLRFHHKNLVSLVGYCYDADKMVIISEFMANGDLKKHLSGKRGKNLLTWKTRIRIAIDVAKGLEYLHYESVPPVVHRDVKATTILLNEHFQAKLDGCRLLFPFSVDDESPVFTPSIVGTLGYIDPEYLRTNKVSKKSDVYSFGVVLLEIITSQPVMDESREKPHIVEWVEFMLTKGDITRIVDSKLERDYNKGGVQTVLELAMACVNPSSIERPTITQVIWELNECLDLEMLRTVGRLKDGFGILST